jgi:hypothetical protein
MAWTDERLDDLTRCVDAGFERVDRDIRDLRTEVGSLRTEMLHEIGGLRTETGDGFTGVAQEFRAVRSEMAQEFRAVRSEMAQEFRDFRGEMAQEFRAMRLMLWRVGGGMIVALAAAIATFSLSGG